MRIIIEIQSEDGNVLGRRETKDWEIAEQSFESLRLAFQNRTKLDWDGEEPEIEQVEEKEELLAREEEEHEQVE